VVDVEGVGSEPEQAPVHVQREEEQRGQDVPGKFPIGRGVEEVPEGAAGEQEAQVDEIVVRPPEPEGGAVEKPDRSCER